MLSAQNKFLNQQKKVAIILTKHYPTLSNCIQPYPTASNSIQHYPPRFFTIVKIVAIATVSPVSSYTSTSHFTMPFGISSSLRFS